MWHMVEDRIGHVRADAGRSIAAVHAGGRYGAEHVAVQRKVSRRARGVGERTAVLKPEVVVHPVAAAIAVHGDRVQDRHVMTAQNQV